MFGLRCVVIVLLRSYYAGLRKYCMRIIGGVYKYEKYPNVLVSCFKHDTIWSCLLLPSGGIFIPYRRWASGLILTFGLESVDNSWGNNSNNNKAGELLSLFNTLKIFDTFWVIYPATWITIGPQNWIKSSKDVILDLRRVWGWVLAWVVQLWWMVVQSGCLLMKIVFWQIVSISVWVKNVVGFLIWIGWINRVLFWSMMWVNSITMGIKTMIMMIIGCNMLDIRFKIIGLN